MERIADGKTIVKMFLSEDFKGKEMGRVVGNFVNSFTFDRKGFIEELEKNKDNERLLNIFLLWILKLEYFKDTNYYDPRNQMSIEIGNDILGILSDEVAYVSKCFNYKGFIDRGDYESGHYKRRVPIEEEILFVETMGMNHRTLQQTFSQLVFEGLALFEGVEKKLSELDKNFYRLPVI